MNSTAQQHQRNSEMLRHY